MKIFTRSNTLHAIVISFGDPNADARSLCGS